MTTYPPELIDSRRLSCRVCVSPCAEYVSSKINHADPCTGCPRRIWHAVRNCSEVAASKAPPIRGLGDAVAVVAQPIARMIDLTAATIGVRTNVAGCGGCKARQAALNKALPFIQS